MSPILICPTLKLSKCWGCKDKTCGEPAHKDYDVVPTDVACGNHIIGPDVAKDPGPTPMTSPLEMTAEHLSKHCITHQPYDCSCPHCWLDGDLTNNTGDRRHDDDYHTLLPTTPTSQTPSPTPQSLSLLSLSYHFVFASQPWSTQKALNPTSWKDWAGS